MRQIVVRMSELELVAARLKALYKTQPDSAVFTDAFADELKRIIERVDSFLIAIAIGRIPLWVYMLAGTTTSNLDIYIAGVKIQSFAGMPQYVALTSATINLLFTLLSRGNIFRLVVLKEVYKIRYSKEELEIVSLCIPEGLYLLLEQPFLSRNYRIKPNRWQETRALFLLLAILAVVPTFLAIQFGVFVNILHVSGFGANPPTLALFLAGLLWASELCVVIGGTLKAEYFQLVDTPEESPAP